jgi:hypothetical protein
MVQWLTVRNWFGSVLRIHWAPAPFTGCTGLGGLLTPDEEILEATSPPYQRYTAVRAPWYVAAGWALEMFTGDAAREHDDLEIALPAIRFGEIMAAFPGFAWDIGGDGQVWPFPEQLANHYQTWLREPATGRYRVDVFREPHVGGDPRMGRQSGGVNATAYVIVVGWATLPALSLALPMLNGNQPG